MINAVTYILENDATVQSLVGGNSRNNKHKVFPVIMPQSEVEPYIVVKLSGKSPMGRDCGYMYSITVVSYHTSYDDVSALNQAVINALTNHSKGTVNGVDFGGLDFIDESDEYAVDRIAVSHEHPVYAKITTFNGIAD